MRPSRKTLTKVDSGRYSLLVFFGKLITTLATYPILTLRVKLQAHKDGSQSYIRTLITLIKTLTLPRSNVRGHAGQTSADHSG
jgi:hypothetical protein